MASSDSPIDKPERGRPKRAELPDVNIDTSMQSINTERASLILLLFTGIKIAMEAADKELGCVTVLGTPAEEGGGGKIKMIDSGCFKDVDVCMMVHPKPFNCIYPTCLASQSVYVTYHGKPSHAAAFPWEGVNALDATVSAFSSLSLLRQQMKPTWRIHGIITEGGAKPNIIPERASLWYTVRAPNEDELQVLRDKVHKCFQASAEATGAVSTFTSYSLLTNFKGCDVCDINHL